MIKGYGLTNEEKLSRRQTNKHLYPTTALQVISRKKVTKLTLKLMRMVILKLALVTMMG